MNETNNIDLLIEYVQFLRYIERLAANFLDRLTGAEVGSSLADPGDIRNRATGQIDNIIGKLYRDHGAATATAALEAALGTGETLDIQDRTIARLRSEVARLEGEVSP